jgi:hypothetical protein
MPDVFQWVTSWYYTATDTKKKFPRFRIDPKTAVTDQDRKWSRPMETAHPGLRSIVSSKISRPSKDRFELVVNGLLPQKQEVWYFYLQTSNYHLHNWTIKFSDNKRAKLSGILGKRRIADQRCQTLLIFNVQRSTTTTLICRLSLAAAVLLSLLKMYVTVFYVPMFNIFTDLSSC